MTTLPTARNDPLAQAATAALRAPSLLNSQPWRWHLTDGRADLRADRTRQLTALDPTGELLLLSCGIALHHAVTALHATGHAGVVTHLPDPAEPDLVARLQLGLRVPADATLYAAIDRRRTDRRPFSDQRPTEADLDALTDAARPYRTRLHILTDDELPRFAAAVAFAGGIERIHLRYSEDVREWTRRAESARDGVAASSVVAAGQHRIAVRDFDTAPRLAAGTGTDRGTVYTVLHTDTDTPHDWINAGAATSAIWLTLTARGLAASPISDVIEVPTTRKALRQLLGDGTHPALALRVGTPAAGLPSLPATTRRPSTRTVVR
ncbi:Acg family FMN-binding oxidoreductase [Dactylosporangium sp. CS-047395]|uniref:Acg family FMN-binding oxidoreductase n=1 Tax=Dactylosporangium sp. CS-047395 TaxID=3239936 RepID=UPI003D8AC17D